eukprot:7355243-Alexandrium_andersonii.AAC.1
MPTMSNCSSASCSASMAALPGNRRPCVRSVEGALSTNDRALKDPMRSLKGASPPSSASCTKRGCVRTTFDGEGRSGRRASARPQS